MEDAEKLMRYPVEETPQNGRFFIQREWLAQRAAYPCHGRPPARTKGGTGRSSIRSRSERRNRYYEPSHGAPAHLARPAVGRTGRCSTEARQLSASRTD